MPGLGYADPPDPDLNARIADASLRLERVVERYNAARDDLAETKARVRALTARAAPVNRQVTVERLRVAHIATMAYKNSPVSAANVMFGADSPRTFLDRLLILDRLSRNADQGVLRLSLLSKRLAAQRHELTATTTRQLQEQHRLAVTRWRILNEISSLEAMRTEAGQETPRSDPPGMGFTGPRGEDPPPPSSAKRISTSDRARTAISFALDQVGKAYLFGAAGPSAYDCSGLTMAAWERAGVYLPHNAARQWWSMPHVPRNHARPGDLVFYYGDIHHVGIYLGGGRVVHAPGYGQPIRVDSVDHAPIVGYGRPA